MGDKKCLHCGDSFHRRYAESYKEFDKRRFCSRDCGVAARRGKPLSDSHKQTLREKQTGFKHTEESKRKMSGENAHRWKGGKPKCIDCGNAVAGFYAKRCFPCYSKQATGENSAHWQGGITPEKAKIRNSKKMIAWRTSVFKRDDYCCQICKARGVHLHAHHIIPFAVNAELRFDIDNGQTLCKECHRMIHSGTNGLKQPAIIKGATS